VRQAAPLVIVEPGPPSQLCLQNANFLLKILDDHLLVTVQTKDADHEEGERIRDQTSLNHSSVASIPEPKAG
jgi:hypothetical protein